MHEFAPLVLLGRVFTSQGKIQKAKDYFLNALELMKEFAGRTDMLPYCLEGVCALPGMPVDKIARLLGKTEAFREITSFVIPISEQPLVDSIVQRLQSQLGKEIIDSTRAAGAILTNEQAIQEAIEVLNVID